ncbi:hypothetical protein L1D44_21560 [Shewanella sp. Isolate13]|uniref:hypothetical protein n=1 Tax=Shewanella sp. Isolate13 TaxID=2908531 RepID=UPI001EFC98F3|nr:hypothetical protein [Shewanella sp. Isolate13]MCG9732366.1 hypothetical protein [Shewanella sp. Isolate13]
MFNTNTNTNTNTNVNVNKLSVKRDRINEPLVDKLCISNKVFTYIKDLMVFASMVGYNKGKRKPLSSDTISISLETYATDQKDAFIYLLALITNKNGVCLKDENIADSIKVFEEYCNYGLEEIQLWLDENPGDHLGIDTIADKIYTQMLINECSVKAEIKPNELEVDF